MEHLKFVVLIFLANAVRHMECVPCYARDIDRKCLGHMAKGRSHIIIQCKKSYVARTCPDMCKKCTTTQPSTKELCIDRPFCTNYNFVLYPNLCQRLAIYCRKSCDFCGGIRTVQPIKKITPIARRITPSTTKPPSPKTTTTTSPKTMNTAAVQTKVTRTSTKLLPNGVCGDKEEFCMKRNFRKDIHCETHGSVCQATCAHCTPTNRCVNLKDRALDCPSKDCQHEDMNKRHRVHKNCAHTCCRNNQLY